MAVARACMPIECVEECEKYFQLQWERRNQFPSDRNDDETIKKEIDENYGNVCQTVKDWIFNDMKRKKQVEKKEEAFDMSLLDRLDDNIKFEIIEFMPTYTKWQELKKEEDYLQSIGFPHRIERSFRLSHRVDTSLVSFHKMRILCKRFNRIMMEKIMNVKQLLITDNMDNQKFAHIATFLRMQRIYKENNCKLPTNSIYLYEDTKIILQDIEQAPSLYGSGNGTPFGVTGFGAPPFTATSLTPFRSTVHNLGATFGSNSTPVDTKEESKDESWENGLEQKYTISSGININRREEEKEEKEEHEYLPLLNRSEFRSTANISHVDCNSFIGKNTTIERLITFTERFANPIIKSLESLKYLDLGGPCRLTAEDDFSLHLEEITCFSGIPSYQPPNVKTISFNEPNPFRGKQSDVTYKQANEIMDYLKNLDMGTVLQFLQEFNTCSFRTFGSQPTHIERNIFRDLKTRQGLELSKTLLDYLCHINFPIETMPFFITYLSDNYSQALFQYMIYLSNEYQEGRLYSCRKGSIFEDPSYSVLFGWHFWKQTSQLVHIFADNSGMFPLILSHSSNLLFEVTFPVLVHACVQQRKDAGQILGELLECNPEAVYQAIAKPVACVGNVHVPLFALLMKQIGHGGFMLQRILDGMTPESVANIPKTERGDNILHIYLRNAKDHLNPYIFIQIMKKAPNFIHEKNNSGSSPYDYLCKMEKYITNIIAKEVGLPPIKH